MTTVKQGEDLHSYAYSPAGKMTSQTDPSGNQTTYSYFDDGRLHEVTFISSQQVSRTFTYQYHASGRLAQITYPTQSGLVLKFADELNNLGWDANGRLTDMVYENSQGELHRFHYEYDPSGNRVALHDAQQGQPLKQWAYGYDWLNRLTGVTLNGDVQRLYGYDECDNRVEILLPASQERWSIAYDIADQILSRSFGPQNGPLNLVEGYEHDADGNMVRRTGTLGQILVNYTWNDSNRLQAITWVPGSPHRRSYNARGIRVVRQNASEKMKFCTSDGLSSVDRTPSGAIAYIHGHQLLGALVNGNFHYFISDGLSTIREVVDESGSVVATFEGDEFGQVIAQSGPAELLEHTYTGALGVRNDGAVLGLHYAQQRYYDASLGRWLSADPIGFEGGLNLYVGMGNKPTNFVDPSGLYLDMVLDVRAGKLTVTDYKKVKGSWKACETKTFDVFTGDKKALNDPRKEAVPSIGPVPRGHYYLGDPVDVSGSHPNLSGTLEWIPILDQSTFKNVHKVLDRESGATVTRDEFYIHPGLISQGCITFKSDIEKGQPGYPGSRNYNELLDMLHKTEPFVKQQMGWWWNTEHSLKGVLRVR